MIAGIPRRTGWLSYYASLEHEMGPFLVEYLAPLVTDEKNAGHLKRFFFIRYTEDTLQLRMRFLPTSPDGAAHIDNRLAAAFHDFTTRFAAERAVSLKQVPYDRSLYFGETMRSVYSELLNECTSLFAFRLLRLYANQRAKLFVMLTLVLHSILSELLAPNSTIAALAEESFSFALAAIVDLKLPPVAVDSAKVNDISDRLLSFKTNVRRGLEDDLDICAIVRLLQRAQRLDEGTFVRIHSLHLLANKLGFTLADECLIFTLLKTMTPDRFVRNGNHR